MSRLNKWMQVCFGLAIAAIPFQLSAFIYESSWGRGFHNPYTSIWFSASEIFILISAILFFILNRDKRKSIGHNTFFLLLCSLISIALLSIFIAPSFDANLAILVLIKLLEALIFYLLVVNHVLKPKDILEIFIVTMSIQALIAIIQVVIQGSVGLNFLGEPALSSTSPHIARFSISGIEIIRGYGTMPHPNVLGGFLVVSILSSFLFSPHLKNERLILLSIQILGIIATFSRSAILALIISIFLLIIWYKLAFIKSIKEHYKISILLALTIPLLSALIIRSVGIISDNAIIERIQGIKNAINIFIQHPFGIGFRQFTNYLDSVSLQSILPWEYQPVHNIPLLVLTETGIQGLILATIVLGYTIGKLYNKRKRLLTREILFKKRVLIVIFIALFSISLFDHYLISLDQGILLCTMIFAIASSFAKKSRDILPLKKEGRLNKILSAQQ